MYRIALKMLLGDRSKYLSLVLGLAFSVLLIAQQGAIFLGLLYRSTGFMQNVNGVDLWVADEHIRNVNEFRPLDERDLFRVRSTPGVLWAEPFYSGIVQAELGNGSFKFVSLHGLDRTTLVGGPQMLEGRIEDLRAPGAIVLEETSGTKLGGLRVGDSVRLNDQRAVVVGFCRAKLGFQSNALIYTTYDNAQRFIRQGRHPLSMVIVAVKPGVPIAQVEANINKNDGLRAYTPEALERRSMDFVLYETGIGINFGITVALGLIVGLVVSASTLYQFTADNQRHLAVLKAMGARMPTLTGMVLIQAAYVATMGFGIGVGLAGLFSLSGRRPGAELSVYFPWQLLVMSLGATMMCVSVGCVLSLRKVARLEPAMVFR